MLNTLAQPYEALAFLYVGCVVGALTTLLRAARMHIRAPWALAMLDALYVFLSALLTAAVCFLALGGRLRLFVLLPLTLGAFAFDRLIGKRALCAYRRLLSRSKAANDLERV